MGPRRPRIPLALPRDRREAVSLDVRGDAWKLPQRRRRALEVDRDPPAGVATTFDGDTFAMLPISVALSAVPGGTPGNHIHVSATFSLQRPVTLVAPLVIVAYESKTRHQGIASLREPHRPVVSRVRCSPSTPSDCGKAACPRASVKWREPPWNADRHESPSAKSRATDRRLTCCGEQPTSARHNPRAHQGRRARAADPLRALCRTHEPT